MKYALTIILTLLSGMTCFAQQAPAPPAPEWGTILGRVVYDGKGVIPAPRMVPIRPVAGQPAQIEVDSLVINKQNSGLANVFVSLRKKPSKIHPGYLHSPAHEVVLEVKDNRFQPHALALWKNDRLLVRNNFAQGLSLTFNSVKDPFSILINPGGLAALNPKSPENVPRDLFCGTHTWMKGYVLFLDNPYFSVTDSRGIFCIPNLPMDEDLEFAFWHERYSLMSNMPNQAPNPANSTVLNLHGRLTVHLTEPVLDLGEFLADPKKLK
jgi:hypothetical protein